MNSNQKSQVEKIFKILQNSKALKTKIQTLESQLSSNIEKIEKIQKFLQKQKVTNEEIDTYLRDLQDIEELKDSSVQTFDQNQN